MPKKSFVLLFLIAALVLSAFLLTSCDTFQDKSFKNEDYIEVESLRIEDANIKMSSYGAPSTYQLNVVTMPANATKKQLTYTIPSDYYQYVTVSNDGLLTAHAVSGDVVVPVTVKSTTNSKATLKINVKVENVSVESVKFSKEQIDLLYNGSSEKIDLSFYPSHAVDGRTPYYFSLDENVATVDENGVVTPVNAGRTTIKVLCPRSTETVDGSRQDKTIKVKAFLPVVVSYIAGQYQLSVSGNPNYNQVIGDFSPIDFTLNILGDNVDPNPDIAWYVDTERVPSNQDLIQFTHTPSATTQITYRIKAIVTPYSAGDEKIRYTLESEPITVYQAFTGISLLYDNLSGSANAYRYGDVATFALRGGDASGTVTKYKWYLSEANDSQNSVLIAETLPSSRDLVRRINVSGNYTLTAKAVDENDNLVTQTPFEFSSEKLLDGDTLVIRTELNEFGLPPDSYHWYVVPCDDDGTYYESEKTLFADTPHGQVLYMPLKTGTFRILVTASIGGVGATVSVHGEKVPYTYVSDVIKVYSLGYRDERRENDLIDIEDPLQDGYGVTYYSSVQQITIEGIGRSSYRPYLKWNEVEGNPLYVVELTKSDGSVVIIDSQEDSGAVFGSNYCYLPTDIVTLNDAFSVRVKQKNGFYSKEYYYGTPNAKGVGDETHILKYEEKDYPFFSTIGYNNSKVEYSSLNEALMDAPAMNGWISSMQELQELLAYILLYKPSSNTYIERTTNIMNERAYDAYTVKLYFAFDQASAMLAYPYEPNADEEEAYEDFIDQAKLILGAASYLPYGFDFVLSLDVLPDKGFAVTFNVPIETSGNTLKESFAEERTVATKTDSYTLKDETAGNDLPIDLRDSVYVYDSDQLVNAVVRGYNPAPQDNDLVTLFRKVKDTAVQIVSRLQSDEEILLALYDYLALNTTYDPNVDELEGRANTKKDLYLYTSYRLEGVFTSYYTACDVGIAKAYAVMCGIFGIPCKIITATVGNDLYTLNKVYSNGKYYIVDVARGMFVSDRFALSSRKSFMLSDEDYAALFFGTTIYRGDEPYALESAQRENPTVLNPNEMTEIVESVKARGAGVYGVEIDFNRSSYGANYQIENMISALRISGVEIKEKIVVTHETNRFIRAIVLITVD